MALHQRSMAAQPRAKLLANGRSAVSLRPDIGNLAHLDSGDGVVARRNAFNLNGRTIRFVPSAGARSYRFETLAGSYDSAASDSGTVSVLEDDDSREIALPFRFPFFATQYRSLYLNSDGNVTFGRGDADITDRSLGRMLSGPPRIAAQFNDLDPTHASDGVRVLSQTDRVVISWSRIPEYRDAGNGPLQTFQLRLFADGVIEIAYLSGVPTEAVVGITPGNLSGEASLVAFVDGVSGEYTSSIAERFSSTDAVDIFAAAQKFYRNHEDAYDYLVIYNTMNVAAGSSAVAYEVTVRNNRSGYGDPPADIGEQAGSKKRLQAILNMGPLRQYPSDPNATVPARLSVGDTPLSVLAHEMGHLFLAFASVRDQQGGQPMLGAQSAHWAFKFNSEASLMEGNRIQDNGAGVSPRFLTTGTVEGFSALDQYLMGFLPPEQVPDSFYVANSRSASATGLPRTGVAFDGDRVNVSVRDVISTVGRRTPDHTVSQRQFRLAFLLVTPAGEYPTAEQIAQVDAYRTALTAYFAKVTGQNASADTSLQRSVSVSAFPALGVVAGRAAPVTLSIEQPTLSPLNFAVRSRSGLLRVPATVTIPAGGVQTTFEVAGSTEGTDDLEIEAADRQYTSVTSRVQVAAASRLRLQVLSDASPVRLQLTDVNRLPYPGATIQATTSPGGSLDRPTAVTDVNGVVEFTWAQSSTASNSFTARLAGGPTAVVNAAAAPVFTASSVLNAASYAAGLVPGGLATLFGTNLGGQNAQVLLNGRSTQVLFANGSQINFAVPSDIESKVVDVVVRAGSSVSAAVPTPVLALQPGIFFNPASNSGAVTIATSGVLTTDQPAQAGDYIAIYATGLGAVRPSGSGLQETVIAPQVTIGGTPAEVLYSGLAPGYIGLYQINVRVPVGVKSGAAELAIAAGSVRSNPVLIQLQ